MYEIIRQLAVGRAGVRTASNSPPKVASEAAHRRGPEGDPKGIRRGLEGDRTRKQKIVSEFCPFGVPCWTSGEGQHTQKGTRRGPEGDSKGTGLASQNMCPNFVRLGPKITPEGSPDPPKNPEGSPKSPPRASQEVLLAIKKLAGHSQPSCSNNDKPKKGDNKYLMPRDT